MTFEYLNRSNTSHYGERVRDLLLLRDGLRERETERAGERERVRDLDLERDELRLRDERV